MTDMRPSAIDKVVHVTGVSWGRTAPGQFWVMWIENGARKVREFRTAFGAKRLAETLDPLGGRQPSVREIRAAERAIQELEDSLVEEERAELAALGVPIMTPQQRKKSERQFRKLGVSVRRHVRRR